MRRGGGWVWQLPDFLSDQRATGKESEELETWHRLPTGRWVSLQAPPGLRVSGQFRRVAAPGPSARDVLRAFAAALAAFST